MAGTEWPQKQNERFSMATCPLKPHGNGAEGPRLTRLI